MYSLLMVITFAQVIALKCGYGKTGLRESRTKVKPNEDKLY